MQKIKTYKWQGITELAEIINGEKAVASIEQLRTELRAQGIFLQKAKLKINFFANKQSSYKDITLFTRQWATLMQAGIPLVQALSWIIKTTSKKQTRNILEKIKQAIEKGNPVNEALLQYPQQFDVLYRNIILIGEQSGTLDKAIEGLANYREKYQALKAKIRKALFYPALILFITSLVTTIMMLVVIPQFQTMFANASITLPVPTQIIIACANWFKQIGIWLIFIIIMACIFLLGPGKKINKINQFYDQSLLKIPFIKNLLSKIIVARFARTLATTLNAGLPVVAALKIIADVSNNQTYQKAILQIGEQLARGETFQFALCNNNLFPVFLREMIAVGEHSGNLENMLEKSANYLDMEIDHIVDTLATLTEPLLMLVLGIIVGFMLIAMYLPIFRLGSVV